MLFNSYVFIFLFLPTVWCLYFFLNKCRCYKLAQVALIVSSFVFYGYQEPKLCFLLGGTIVANYFFHRVLIHMNTGKPQKLVLCAGILVNLSLIFYFKYFNFFLENVNRLVASDFALKNIVLPLGISFFTFQQISMLVDSSKPDMEKYSFIEYALFVSYFPQLIAGPIVLHQELIPQFREEAKKRIDYGNLISGVEYFVFGFAKKVLVADSFARICDVGYENISTLNVYSTVLTILAFTLQIYFDFSGYCDMACGLGKLFNFELPINFDSPYKATSIAEFWKRWHKTLTRFLTTYLYIPLGGNRKGQFRTCLNILIVFTISGLWHGAAWTFVLWGIMHGIAQVVYRLGKNHFDKLPKWLRWVGTFSFINIAWVFFRAEFFRQPFRLLKRLFIGGGGLCQEPLLTVMSDNSVILAFCEGVLSANGYMWIQQVSMLVWFGIWTIVCMAASSSHEIIARKIRTTPYFAVLGILFAWTCIWLLQISKFIYFNF